MAPLRRPAFAHSRSPLHADETDPDTGLLLPLGVSSTSILGGLRRLIQLRIPKTTGIGYSQRRAVVVVVEGATVDFARRPTTMIIIGIVLALVGLAYLCWLLFALAVYALPLFAGVTAGLATYHSGSGPIGAIIVGLIASSVTLVLGQIAFTTLRSPLIRAVIALLFVVPAAIAGYHAALGLAHIGIPADGWRQAVAVAGAIIVAATAWARMVLSAPRPTPDKALPPA